MSTRLSRLGAFTISNWESKLGVIERLVGTAGFRQQIMTGTPENEIGDNREPGLTAYNKMRTNHLPYL